jgi:hypothetical protein
MCLDHADLVLLMLGAPTADPGQDGRCAGITRLEKLAFLVKEDSHFDELTREPSESLHFRPYHYGPYTREIYDAVDLLVGIGLIRERRQATGTSLDLAEELDELDPRDLGIFGGRRDERYVERVFELSEKGEYVARVLAERVGSGALSEITRIKDEYGTLPLRILLRRVYAAHPEMTTQSLIRDKL